MARPMNFVPFALRDMWLSTVNPLRGLTMSRVVAELEAGQRGDYAMLQWLYHFIEKRDATLRGAKRRIRSSLLKLDWDIKIDADIAESDKALAEKQQAALKAEYRKVKNFRKALSHLASAEFRGYAHLEKHYRDGSVVKLEPVPQWHFCRDGIYGGWLFQEDALRGGINGVSINPRNFIIREVEDPIDEIALISFVRKSLSQKDFDAFIARYGIPFVFWVLSEAMALQLANEPEKLAEYMLTMRGIGSDGEGIIPGGTLETLDASAGGKGDNPFLQHIKYQDEQIVMAATSGKLTMLNDATGIGGGNSETHADTFDEIALALAMEVSETMQEQFDAPALDRLFPGQPHLVYFELAAKDAEDVTSLVKHATELDGAGIEMDVADLSERTGYKLIRRVSPPAAAPGMPAPVSLNRYTAPAKDDAALRKAASGLLNGFGKIAEEVLSGAFPEFDSALATAAVTEPADEPAEEKEEDE